MIAVMCVQLVACGEDKEPETPGTDAPTAAPQGGETTAPPSGGETTAPPSGGETKPPVGSQPTDVVYVANLVKDGASDYVIVYPAGTADDSPVKDACTALANAFEAKFGITLNCVDDSTAEVANEILVGKTNRKQSADVLAPLRFKDTVATVVDTKLVVISPADEELGTVVGQFVAKINETVGNNMTLSSKNELRNAGKYDIQELKISGTSVEEFVIVVPELNGLEHYVARILSRHIAVFSGYRLEIVTEDTEKAAHEIRIGKTSRTVTTVAAGEYAVIPDGGNMEIVFNDIYAAGALAYTMTTQYFNRTACWLDIKLVENGTKVFVGDKWDADANGNGIDVGDFVYDARVTSETSATAPKADANDLRIMYHDVNGHIDLEAESTVSSVAARAALLVETYKVYKPDVLCLSEAGQDFPTEAAVLFTWLEENGYKMIRDDAKGLALPIFYNTARVSLVTGKDSNGYLAREAGGTKGVAYATFKDSTNGEIFGVVNVHYSGDGDVYELSDKPTEAEENLAFIAGSKARDEESQLVLKAVDKIRSANKTASAVFVGGNFNANRGKYAVELDEETGLETGVLIDPLETLTNDGLVEVRDKTELPAEKNSQLAPYDGGSKLSYVEDYDYVSFTKANERPADEVLNKDGTVKYAGSADFIFYDGKASDFNAKIYEVVTDVVAATSSDHLPHFVDIAWN